jgi:hypothetical protein
MRLDPLAQAVLADAESGRHIGHFAASLRDLLDRFGPECFGVTLVTDGTSYWA